jgi:hypothetical protein
MLRMLGMRVPPATDLQGLPPEALALIERMQRHIEQQEQALLAHHQQLAEGQALLQRKDREIALRDAKLEKLEFEIARFKRWKFGAKTEAMNAQQRRLFDETLAEDEAALQAALERLRAESQAEGKIKPKTPLGSNQFRAYQARLHPGFVRCRPCDCIQASPSGSGNPCGFPVPKSAALRRLLPRHGALVQPAHRSPSAGR